MDREALLAAGRDLAVEASRRVFFATREAARILLWGNGEEVTPDPAAESVLTPIGMPDGIEAVTMHLGNTSIYSIVEGPVVAAFDTGTNIEIINFATDEPHDGQNIGLVA